MKNSKMKNKKTAALAAQLVCTSALLLASHAGGTVLEIGSAGAPATGVYELSAGTTATGVRAYVQEGTELVVTNGDLRLDAPSAGTLPEVFQHGGTVRLASAMSAPDGLLLKSDSKMLVQEDFYPSAWNHSPTATLFATGRDIDDYIPVMGKRTSRPSGSPTPGYPHVLKRSPGELTFEMQYVDDYLRSIKVRLFNVGEDIYAQVLWARYDNASRGYGSSLENSYTAEVQVHSKVHVPSSSSAVWFGVHTLALMPVHCTIAASGDAAVSGRLALEGVHASFEGSGDIAGTFSNPITMSNSVLRVKRGADTTITSPLSVSNAMLYYGGVTNEDVEVVSGAIATIGDSKATLFTDANISDLEITGAYARQNTTAFMDHAWFGWCERCETEIIFQAQGYGSDATYNKCAIVRVWQEGSNIVGQVIDKPYYKRSEAPLGTDMRLYSTPGQQGAYNATNITYNLTRRIKSSVLRLAGTAVNGDFANVVVASNALVYVNSQNALPVSTQGVVTVESGGEVRWCADYVSGRTSSQLPRFCVRGRLLYYTRGWCHQSIHELDGGVMALYGDVRTEVAEYLNNLIFRDGARLVGRRPRVGLNSDGMWIVEGASPSYWESGGYLVGNGSVSSEKEGFRKLTVQVADVTGDGAPDFISLPATSSGYPDSLFTDYPSWGGDLQRLKIVKTGAGTWEWRAKGGAWTGRLVLNAGAVRFTKSESLDAGGLGVQLGGGELQLADYTTNAIPKLVVSADSTLNMGEEAVVEFPNVDVGFATGVSFENDAILSIVGPVFEGRKRIGVRVGTSACLDAGTLGHMRYNGRLVEQDEDGYLRTFVRGMMLIFK